MKTTLIKETAGVYVLTDSTRAIHIVKQRNGLWLAYAAYNSKLVTDELASMSKAIHYAKHMLKNS